MRRLGALLLVLAVATCKSSSSSDGDAGADAGVCTGPDFAGAPLGVRCNALVDAKGRTVLLHGVNARVSGVFDVSFDDGRKPLEPIPAFEADDARQIRAVGFNALRLPLDWSAIEPTESGGFADTYLDAVAHVVDLCRAAGLFVLLDMHEDAYSKEIGEDGAPLWAIVPPPTQKLGGPLDDLQARRLSKQVIDAFTTFFGDSPDSLRLRDRYAKMLAHVMARFAEDDAVVGMELFNEPLASDLQLQRIYGPMITAIHDAAPKKLVFFEPSVTRNEIDHASLGSGSLGPGTVYAPHVYTGVFTGDAASRAALTKDALRPSNASAREEADSFGAPLAVTEFGFDPQATNFASYVRWQMELQDEALASSFLWLWAEESQGGWGFFDFDPARVKVARPTVFDAMRRVRAEAIAGQVRSVVYDADTLRFEVRFTGDDAVAAPNVVSLGGAFQAYDATCDGAPVAPQSNDPLWITCGGRGDHVLVVAGK